MFIKKVPFLRMKTFRVKSFGFLQKIEDFFFFINDVGYCKEREKSLNLLLKGFFFFSFMWNYIWLYLKLFNRYYDKSLSGSNWILFYLEMVDTINCKTLFFFESDSNTERRKGFFTWQDFDEIFKYRFFLSILPLRRQYVIF